MAVDKSQFLAWTATVQPNWSRGLPEETTGKRIAYFMNVFPFWTETFVYREVKALRSLGTSLSTFSIRNADPSNLSEEAKSLIDDTYYILPAPLTKLLGAHFKTFFKSPLRYLKILYGTVAGTHIRFRDRLRSLAHFTEAVYVLPVIKRLEFDHLHAHFAVGSTTCAWVLSQFLDLPFSFTAHAYDIWLDRLLLPEKLADAEFVMTCTQANHEHLLQTYEFSPDKLHTVYHGVDLSRFSPRTNPPNNPVPRLLCVGRLVEQKGITYLLDACSILKKNGTKFDCQIVGDGPLLSTLQARTTALGLDDCVHFVGRVFQEQIIKHYAMADLFVLPCVPAANNDRDGIPNTLIEAMACGLPIVSTEFSGIPELVTPGVHGLLAEPGNAEMLADALLELISEPETRLTMGRVGREVVVDRFSLEASAGSVFKLLAATK